MRTITQIPSTHIEARRGGVCLESWQSVAHCPTTLAQLNQWTQGVKIKVDNDDEGNRD